MALEATLLAILLRRRKAATGPSELLASLTSGIYSGRQAARQLGRNSIAAAFSVSSVVNPMTRLSDATRAQQIAQNHLSQVRVAEAKARVAEVANPAAKALAETEYRVRTIAASETFSAASEERLTAAREVQSELGIVIEKEWNAEGDSCPVCADLDGTVVAVNDSFPGGGEPGSAHAGCRCWLEILTSSVRAA